MSFQCLNKTQSVTSNRGFGVFFCKINLWQNKWLLQYDWCFVSNGWQPWHPPLEPTATRIASISTPPAPVYGPFQVSCLAGRQEAGGRQHIICGCCCHLGQQGLIPFPPSTQVFIEVLEASVSVRPLPLCQISGVIHSKVIREGLAHRQIDGRTAQSQTLFS